MLIVNDDLELARLSGTTLSPSYKQLEHEISIKWQVVEKLKATATRARNPWVTELLMSSFRESTRLSP